MKNVLFIMTDQQRNDSLGINSEWMITPHLDSIALSGMVFDSCITNSPLCVPARFSLATGKSPVQLGIDNNIDVDIDPADSSWTRTLSSLGYQMAVFGKTHLHRHKGDIRDREDLLRQCGFNVVNEIGGPRASAHIASNMTDLWQSQGVLEDYRKDVAHRIKEDPLSCTPSNLPFDLYADNYVGDEARDYLENVDEKHPWFCWASFGGPHEPWDTPLPFASMYSDTDVPHAIVSKHKADERIPLNSIHGRRFKSTPEISKKEIEDIRKNYAGNVSLIDEKIGELLGVVKERGMFDNTIIVFTSDHGEMNGDHDLVYKGVFFDASVRVPLIVSTPELRAQQRFRNLIRRNPALVQLSDVGPTILELVGKSSSMNAYGRSFSACVIGRKSRHRNVVFSELAGETMVANRHWKIVFNKKQKPYMCFNTKHDPTEKNNLSGSLVAKVVEKVASGLLKNYRLG